MLNTLNSNNNIRINPDQNFISTKISSRHKEFIFLVDGTTDKIGINTDTPDELLHVNGNVKIGSNTTDGITIGSYEVVNHPTGAAALDKTLSIFRETSYIGLYGNSTYILGPGVDGQKKYICIGTVDSAGSATITVTGNGFTSIVMTTAGKSVSLQYIIDKWVCLSNNGATIS